MSGETPASRSGHSADNSLPAHRPRRTARDPHRWGCWRYHESGECDFHGAANVSQPVRLHGPLLVAVFRRMTTAPRARRAWRLRSSSALTIATS